MKIVNNRKMLISLMTVFGFSVFVESNCCNGASARSHLQQIRQAKAQEAEQARQAQLEEENRRAQDINDIGARLQIVENNLQDQINPNINNINALRNDLQELREQIARQGHHITFLDLFDLLLGGAVVVIGAVYYLRGSSRK